MSVIWSPIDITCSEYRYLKDDMAITLSALYFFMDTTVATVLEQYVEILYKNFTEINYA
jgi:hypothetical protein